MNIPSYGKVWNFNDSVVRQQFGNYVEIEEKIDGSQFSVMNDGGRLVFRSKNVEVHPEAPGMFAAAVAGAERIHNFRNFPRGYTFRFEFLATPKHNTLAYTRVPQNNLMLYEVEHPSGEHLDRQRLNNIAQLYMVELTPQFYSGPLPSFAQLDAMLDRVSILGNEKIEGLVIKARDRRNEQDGKMLKAKYVSPAFKERHQRAGNPGGDASSKDILASIIDNLATEARYRKAVQDLRERGDLEGDVRDIGKIIARLQEDTLLEEEGYIKDELFKWAKRRVTRGVSQGVPQWYKEQLDSGAIPA